MTDYTLPVRRAMMAALKHDPPFTDLVPAASIYPGKVPANASFPFSRFGSMIATPFRATGLDSSAHRITVQAFTKPLLNGTGAEIVTAEDQAHKMGAAMMDALDGQTLTLEGGMKLRLTWVQTIAMIDGNEPDAWMVTSIFTGEVSA